jgi:two-component system heavy metal sensor histidine kinase CusS
VVTPTIGKSIAIRLSAWCALTFALVIVASGFYLHGALEKGMTARHEALLTTMATLVQKMMEDVPSLDRLVEQPDTIGHVLAGHTRLRVWIYGNNGHTLFASSRTAVPKEEWESLAASSGVSVASKLWESPERKAYRLAVTRFSSERPGIGQGFIVFALDASEEADLLRLFESKLLVAMMVSMLASALIGFFMVRRGLRPIARVAQSARRVTANRLNEKLDPQDVPQELHGLVESFNTMLARLDDSFRRLSEFSADLAHDLRTPLTSLLGRSEAALLQKRNADEYRETLEANVETAQRMSALVSDMLFLARADHAQSALAYEKVDLRAEVERLIEFFGIACEERGIGLEVHGRATAFFDRGLLRRALSNLLSNAVRHSPDKERVDVMLGGEEHAVTVSVIDRGAGVSPEHASRIFDRFYRADPSRTRISGGTGLGLAITQSIMWMHGGDVSVKSEPGKATAFTLTFPTRYKARPGVPIRDSTPAQQQAAPRKAAPVPSP